MANVKKKTDFTRVSINLPTYLVNKVKDYADSVGVNATTGYIMLLNNALDQKATLTTLPEVFKIYDEIKKILPNENDND